MIYCAGCRMKQHVFIVLAMIISLVPLVHGQDALCMDGELLFREDFGGNAPSAPRVGTQAVTGMSYYQLTDDYFGIMMSGCYLLTKSGYCNGDTSVNNLGTRGSQWHIQDDHTYPNDYTRGYMLEIDGRGDGAAFYSKTISGLTAGTQLTFAAYVVNVLTWGMYVGSPGVYAYPRLRFELTDPASSSQLASYSTGDIPFDSAHINDLKAWKYSAEWRLVGMNFTVPVGTNSITLTIYNDALPLSGNDFAIDDIEIRQCVPPAPCPDTLITRTADTTVCDYELPFTWRGLVFAQPGTQNTIAKNARGCDTIEYVCTLDTVHCELPCPDIIHRSVDTIVCDTLLPFTWRGMTFAAPDQRIVMEQSPRGCDSIEYTYRFDTVHCERPCPEMITYTFDTVVCDTMLPLTWHGLRFSQAATQHMIQKSPRGCDSIELVYRLDTVVCHRLYPIIVNKYNWVLLCNNVLVAQLFPEQTVTGYQWYKDEAAIPDATSDYYSEQAELYGSFQLRIKLDSGEEVWSTILTIAAAQPQPVRMFIYNAFGLPIREDEMTRGVYLIRYEQGDRIWTEKRIVP